MLCTHLNDLPSLKSWVNLLNYASNEEQLECFSWENYIIYLDLEEVVQVACCLFQFHILTAKLSEFKLPMASVSF